MSHSGNPLYYRIVAKQEEVDKLRNDPAKKDDLAKAEKALADLRKAFQAPP